MTLETLNKTMKEAGYRIETIQFRREDNPMFIIKYDVERNQFRGCSIAMREINISSEWDIDSILPYVIDELHNGMVDQITKIDPKTFKNIENWINSAITSVRFDESLTIRLLKDMLKQLEQKKYEGSLNGFEG